MAIPKLTTAQRKAATSKRKRNSDGTFAGASGTVKKFATRGGIGAGLVGAAIGAKYGAMGGAMTGGPVGSFVGGIAGAAALGTIYGTAGVSAGALGGLATHAVRKWTKRGKR